MSRLFRLCSDGGRTEYAKVLTELVRKRINDQYVVVLNEELLSEVRTVTDEENVLLRTKVLKYRAQQYTLPTPCPLGTLVETISGIVCDLGGSIVSDTKFDLEWIGSALVFVPTLRHRFACVLANACNVLDTEFVCLDIHDFYADRIFPLFDKMAEGLDEVPENMKDLVRGRCTLSVYDLRLQRFLTSPLENAYASWIIQNCV